MTNIAEDVYLPLSRITSILYLRQGALHAAVLMLHGAIVVDC